MVDVTQRLQVIRQMIGRGDYFCITRGRQYGKTTTLNALVERYEGDFDNIVGFPVKRIKEELQELFGCDFSNLT